MAKSCFNLVALGLVSMMLLHCLIVNTVELVDCIKMCKADCFGKTRLAHTELIMSWKALLSLLSICRYQLPDESRR